MSADFWILVIFAFFFGVLIGWLLQRRTAARMPQAEQDAPPAKISLIEAELENAKMLLKAKDADASIASETLASLEETIARANERLKLIVQAVKSAKFGD